MKYPNLRYGNPNELAYYAQGIPVAALAKRLRRSERSVVNWLSGRERVPFWVPELLRLQDMESATMRRQMGFEAMRPQLGTVSHTGKILEFKPQCDHARTDNTRAVTATTMAEKQKTNETGSCDQRIELYL